MAIRVSTSKFFTSHFREPRGNGLWMFEMNGKFVSVTDNYRNAVAEAKRQFRRKQKVQDGVMEVCP